MYVLYSVLCGMLIYVAILAAFGRRMHCNRWSLAFGSVALAVSFGVLALSTAGITRHGQLILITRLGFVGYALSLALIIGRYWLETWRARRR